ncbi:MAG: OmpA family protein [Chitinophagaceae bacterium]|nr:OmpA family protein [Chitinophagaceae bacterium]
MKKAFVVITMILMFSFAASTQIVKDKVKTKTNQRVDSKVDRTIDKGLDKVEEGINNIFKKKDKSATKTADTIPVKPNETNLPSGTKNTEVRPGFSDFVPGQSVIFEDRFEKDALSDFPALWNTNGSGMIVKIEGKEDNWLNIAHGSVVNPVLEKPLPENCTIEFDLFLQAIGEQRTPMIQFGLTPVKDILKEDLYYKDKFYVSIGRYEEKDGRILEYGMRNPIGNKNEFNLPAYVNKILHVSIAINKTRIRVYFDQTKLIDLPRALTPEMRNNFYLANISSVPASELGAIVGNLRIASADLDARSLLIKQLMEEGKAVTNDILFDVNSDVIKPSSYGVIAQIGEAMKSHNSLKIKITGHTDSDGKSADNLVLSQKRSESVKKYLVAKFNISDDRIQTDGKGASVPVVSNSNEAGKAKNRRVEFVKL